MDIAPLATFYQVELGEVTPRSKLARVIESVRVREQLSS
jgi:hypothetical protein